MINSEKNMALITKELSNIIVKISIDSSQNITSSNIYAENFFKDLLNIAFEYNLENKNAASSNFKSIDLADDKQRIAVQVTSTSRLAKIRDTLNGFVRNRMYENYDRLIVFIISNKTTRQSTKNPLGITAMGENFSFEFDRDVINVKKFISKISQLPPKKIETIAKYISENTSNNEQQSIAPPSTPTTLAKFDFNVKQISYGTEMPWRFKILNTGGTIIKAKLLVSKGGNPFEEIMEIINLTRGHYLEFNINFERPISEYINIKIDGLDMNGSNDLCLRSMTRTRSEGFKSD